ncbi:hypothetical protein ACOBQX_07400 [Actinokineospora sp. G85]|uniref:hypothetical protein n=1 Tax=Actinokineospora sp. G85 TaxID=3406626 RepID=UPI003C72EC49
MTIATPPRLGPDQLATAHLGAAVKGNGYLVLGRSIDALSMSVGRGAEVNHRLGLVMQRCPIIWSAVEDTWTFLTGPRTPLRTETVADLTLLGVTWPPAGARVQLPAAMPGAGDPVWVQAPGVEAELPGWSTVVGAARRTRFGGW